MPHPRLALAIGTVGSVPRLCTARRADPAHRLARTDARAGQDTKDNAARTEHDQGQSSDPWLAATIDRVPVQTLTEMTHANSAASGKLDELRTLASHLTAGSLLQAATLQLIAEQENAKHRYAPARIAELSRQA